MPRPSSGLVWMAIPLSIFPFAPLAPGTAVVLFGLGMTARKVLASLATIKSGDILLPLIDGRELRLRRVSRPDAAQAELLTRLGLDLPEKLGADSVNGPDVVQT